MRNREGYAMRIIHFEDSMDKHMEIFRILRRTGIQDAAWVTSVNDGMQEIEAAFKNGVPFDLAITDMHYPIKSGEPADWKAGERLIQLLQKQNIDLPVIVCSTGNFRIPGAYGCVWYSDLSDWETELMSLVERYKRNLKR